MFCTITGHIVKSSRNLKYFLTSPLYEHIINRDGGHMQTKKAHLNVVIADDIKRKVKVVAATIGVCIPEAVELLLAEALKARDRKSA